MPLENQHFIDVRRVQDHPFLSKIYHLEEVDSTNDLALAIGERGTDATPLLIVADRQTKGRGRGTHRWWSGPGSLTFSLLLDGGDLRLPLAAWPRLSLLVGLAVARAIRGVRPTAPVALKWPNDVFLAGRKLGGVLIEAASGARPRVVIGIGLNVNNSLADAPAEVAPRATSLRDIGGDPVPLTDLLVRLVDELQVLAGVTDDELTGQLTAWRELCILTGRHVEVVYGETIVAGQCLGIDDTGALCLDTAAGWQRCHAGVVSRVQGILEPSSGGVRPAR